MTWLLRLPLVLFLAATLAAANEPPAAPTITEPVSEGAIANPEDVHMEVAPFSDPDNDGHFCTDWEIWLVSPSERVWVTSCIGGVERLHTHLGDGVFENSHAGTGLRHDTDYRLRVRFRDDSGVAASEWSAWTERSFRTGPPTQVFPLDLSDVLDFPDPAWTLDAGGGEVVAAGGADPAGVQLLSADEQLLLEFTGTDDGVAAFNPPGLAGHAHARVRLLGGASGLILGDSTLSFSFAGQSEPTEVYLPGVSLAPGAEADFWVARNGGTYYGEAQQTVPDFSSLARGAPVPWQVMLPGYRVEVVATGFKLPVNIAFAANPGDLPGDPFYYVAELYGEIKVVTRDGTVSDYATGLVNFNPTGAFPGSGEQGLAGLAVDPQSGDLFASVLYDPPPEGGPHYPKVIRLASSDGGLTAATITTLLDMPGETQGQSHQISNVSFGPDGKLYVHMGDGFVASTGQDLDSYRGKILRMNADGSPCTDNPFYNAGDGINSRDYIIAWGLRNPFGGGWRAADGRHYSVENGPAVDRISFLVPGRNYLWDGSDFSMTSYAIFNWMPPAGPVNIAFVQPETFNASGFPPDRWDLAYVTESGPTYASGPAGERSKMITTFPFDLNGNLVGSRATFARYTGTGKASVVALAPGPDGLYFSDFYKDQNYQSPIDRGSNILRIRYVGRVDFAADVTGGPQAPFATQFTDLSDIPAASEWFWEFGDGQTSTERDPVHVYADEGIYDVRLTVVSTSSGAQFLEKQGFITVAGGGLRGEYFDDINFTAPAFERIDSEINFNWGSGAPTPTMGANTFSIRWTGQIEPQFSETYTFYATTDDGVRVWVNNVLVINGWVDQAPTERSGAIALTAGQHYDIKMEYYENGGGAVAELRWSSPSQPKQIIPAARLIPPFDPADLTVSLDDSADPALAGGPLSYTAVASNPGSAAASGVWLVLTTPPGFSLTQIDSSGDCAADGNVVECFFGTLPGGGSASMTVTGTLAANTAGPIQAAAEVSANELDPTPGDNFASQETLVHRPPAILTEPQSTWACAGGEASFSVSAAGFPAPTFQWRIDGEPISGADAATLLLSPVDPNLAGDYDVVLTNAAGSATSSAAVLSVDIAAPQITLQPRGRTVTAGDTVSLSVAAQSLSEATYQWRRDGLILPGQTQPTLVLNPVQLADGGLYRCEVTNVCGTVASQTVRVRVFGRLSAPLAFP